MTVRSLRNAPLHLRLVLGNGLVLALGVLAMSFAPEDRDGVFALGVLAVGLGLVVAVNTRHLRQTLTPLVDAVNALRNRWEGERRVQVARSSAGREYDGQQVAEDLHDKVADSLAAALVALNTAAKHATPDLKAELDAVQRDTRSALLEVRRITRSLRPEMLEDRGLMSALAALGAGLTARSPRTAVHRRFEGTLPALDGETELVIYRVAEEALTNIARHADARHVELALRPLDTSVVLEVIDDGTGIGSSRPRSGLLGMHERAALVGGLLAVTNLPEGGTRVRLEVPSRPRPPSSG
jgi:two-component system sensor histidine kinase UhpB